MLLACLRSYEEDIKAAQLQKYIEGDWKEVFLSAKQHGVLHILFHELKPLESGLNIPESMWEELHRWLLK